PLDLGARHGLRLALDGEDAEPDRNAVFQREALQAPGAFGADIVVMRRLATDDAAQGDIAVEWPPRFLPPPFDGDADRRRDLEGAGHGKALIAGAGGVERQDGAPAELLGDMRIIRRLDDHDVARISHCAAPLRAARYAAP